MSGDYSRIAFDPWLDDLGVLLQQGRPLTDRDWNDLVFQLSRRIQAGTLDTVGAAVVPAQTPDGFKIEAAGGTFTIGRGRMYVDGLLAENHGAPPSGQPLGWDPRLAERFGSEPLSYSPQPYDPNPPALPTGGPHLVYLDVWQREVTPHMRRELVEPALGVDTTTRLQTVWQVKVLPNVGSDVTCATPLDQFPGWLPQNAPSAGRLSTNTKPVPGQPDPCQVPPAGGYKGLENQLYRIEIHQGGAPGTATFKWSRDNASVETGVTAIPSLTQLVVESVGKDSVLRFSAGDLIEITDDWLELHNLPGLLRRIKAGDGVDDATRTITLDQALPAGQFPTPVQNLTDPERHTRIRRWDQKTTIFDSAGNELASLVTADGSITVPAGGTELLLEYGIVVTFGVQPPAGLFRTGDWWVFAARSVDASIDELDQAAPRGIHHHYAKLALVTFPGDETDCRTPWPPPIAAGGDTCACTVCVTPARHASGELTVQMAIDQVTQAGGGTVCLEVGTYAIAQRLNMTNATSLRLVGKGPASRLQGAGRVLEIENSRNVALQAFAVLCRPAEQAPDAALSIRGSQDIDVDHLSIRIENENPAWSCVGLAGPLTGVRLAANTLFGFIGVRTADPTGAQIGLTDLRIDDNVFECRAVAVQLTEIALHQQVSRLHGNRVTGCQQTGFVVRGATAPRHGIEIAGNVLTVEGDGIMAGIDGLRLLDNDILQAVAAAPGTQNGVILMAGAGNENGLENTQIIGNRIAGFDGAAIVARLPRLRALEIKQNQIERVGSGLIFEVPGPMEQVAIENNQFSTVAGFGMLADGTRAQLLTSGNHLLTRGPEPAVQMMFQGGESVFTDNNCRREGGTADSADVMLGADTVIVASNRVQGTDLSMDLRVQPRRCTVLGNIARGRIIVDGNALAPPWTPLNLQNLV